MQHKRTIKNKNRFKGKRSSGIKSNIDPSQLVKSATFKKQKKYEPENSFEQFKLHKQLECNIAAKGYVRPTEIQDKSISDLLEAKNLIGIAATGTGKTGAFLIPIIQHLLIKEIKHALVVVPTRELALQVMEGFESLAKSTKLKLGCFIGGTNVDKDTVLAKKGLNFIVGTPGRLNDLIAKRALNLYHFDTLVIDEFDRLLDMGFVTDVMKIAEAMSRRTQTLLFSATVDKTQRKWVDMLVKDAVQVNVTNGAKASDNVDQRVIKVQPHENKFQLLKELLSNEECSKVILFAETKRAADRLKKQLFKAEFKADVIHGDKSQNYRTKAILKFKNGEIDILVATDVAARGIDVDGVSHVINYQIPKTMDSYIHRIGRTGRADQVGVAYTFLD